MPMSHDGSWAGRKGFALGPLVLIASCASGFAVPSRDDGLGDAGASRDGSAGQTSTLAGSTGSSGSGSLVAWNGSGGVIGVGGATGAGGSKAAGRGGSSGGSARAGRGGSSGSAGAAGSSGSQGRLFFDDFEDGNFTAPAWVDAAPDLNGKWEIASADGGKALAQTAAVGDWIIAVSGDYRWTDQLVEAKVKFTSSPGKVGIFARMPDTRNYYFLYIDGTNIVLRKRVNNNSNDIQKIKTATVEGTTYTLKLSVIGSQLAGYLDGKMIVSGSDTGIAAGGVGVGSSDCSAEFDDVSVSN
jgi:hypothetical protein